MPIGCPVISMGMVTLLEVGLILLALAFLFGAYKVIRALKPFIVNAIIGILVLLLAQAAGIAVAITPVAILVTALAGIPGAILVILLAIIDIAFVPGAIALPLQ